MSLFKVKNTVFLFLVFLLIQGCGSSGNESVNSIGNNLILTNETFIPKQDLSKEQLQAFFTNVAHATNTQEKVATTGIQSFKILYKTHDDSGKEVIASGLVTIPKLTPDFLAYIKQATGSDLTLSIVSDQHGTIFNNKYAPSQASLADNMLPAIFSGIALFMTVQPDYIGFGDSNQTHPYIIKKSSANATVDMIEAAIAFANKAGLPINGQVFLSGYSEGGYATLATAREIQKNHPEINLKAVAPMAGPYDMETMGMATLGASQMAFPPFLADVAYSYSDIYGIDITSMVNEPYADRLSTIFDTKHTTSQIVVSLPLPASSPKDLFSSSFVDDFLSNPNNPLRVRFKENSLLDWTPKMPVKLVQCTNDEIIPYQISSKKAYETFIKKGAKKVSLVPITNVSADYSKGEMVHSNCAGSAYSVVISWFLNVRKGGE